ncbi:MAG TPA: RNA-binding S4 domain-containing protein [Gammaproteobacteria bacterium]|jgi:ribosome-associated heat shock protein Hsp15|nr:RNA-binding S4 domain-containing protein [Gammaproteobacteria bacterium]
MSRDDGDDSGRLRIDRWLWCARLFKSRSAAAEAVRAGRVRLNGSRVKPAHDAKVGDAIAVDVGAAQRDVTIAAIPSRRGPASEAAACYVESSESLERRRAAAEARALAPAFAPPTRGRPDKRTRRLLLRARDRR